MNDNTTPTSVPSPSPDVLELNKRRELIKALYQEVLGRDADINGLSYYTVHKEVSEHDIRKQMTQSTDHRDLVLRAQKYAELEKKCIDLEDQVIRLQNSNNEKENLINSLRAVTANPQYQSMTTPADDFMMSQQENMNPQMQQPQMASMEQLMYPNNNVKKSTGCFGFIKKILGMR